MRLGKYILYQLLVVDILYVLFYDVILTFYTKHASYRHSLGAVHTHDDSMVVSCVVL